MVVLHILSFGFVLGVTAIADKEAFAWVRGLKSHLDQKTMRGYHALIWIGLISLIVTGIFLVYPYKVYLLSDLLFDIKLFFVLILVINALLIGRLMDVSFQLPFRALSSHDKTSLVVSGAISVFCWAGALASALWLFS